MLLLVVCFAMKCFVAFYFSNLRQSCLFLFTWLLLAWVSFLCGLSLSLCVVGFLVIVVYPSHSYTVTLILKVLSTSKQKDFYRTLHVFMV